MHKQTTIAIEPSYPVYENNELFSNPVLNRDGTLLPAIRLREECKVRGISVITADCLKDEHLEHQIIYLAMGKPIRIHDIKQRYPHVKAHWALMEPPIVLPGLYSAIPEYQSYFDKIYIHNTRGDGYSLKGVDRSKLHTYQWPQPFNHILFPDWEKNQRLCKIIVVNGHHKPRQRQGELYSARLEDMASLAKHHCIDLYGRGWRYLSRSSLWWPFIKNATAVMPLYRGPLDSKFETMSQYDFALCYENMSMEGYITEKIFDCFYAGTIPIYLGSPKISDTIPTNTFISRNDFKSTDELWDFCKKLTVTQKQDYRMAAKAYLESKEFSIYYDSLHQLIESI